MAAAKNTWTLKELEDMASYEFQSLLEMDIPSDQESVEADINQIMNDDDFEDLVDNQPALAEVQQNTNESWESEDDWPLSRIRHEKLKNRITWTQDVSHVCRVNPFIKASGPNIPIELDTPIDIFLQLFTEDLISNIVFQTNLYALQKAGGSTNFVPITAADIKSFLGLNIMMSMKKMPSYKDYWSSRDDMRDNFISSVMSRDKFAWILSNLHLNDNSMEPGRKDANYDKLYKIRPLITELSKTFRSSMKPNEYQSIDESMIKFKGRSSLRQYMPNKPIKRGYKVWVRCDSTGYMCEFQIYTGKVMDATEKNLGHRVIKELSKDLVGGNHKVFFDNYFNSVDLQRDLLANGIYACGTIRKGRKMFPELKVDKKMKRGDSDFRVSTDGLGALKWMDRRSVLLLSNYHDPSTVSQVPRKSKDGSTDIVNCPQMVKDYNAHMGYVDKHDMLKSLYEINRKSHKWWHRIFFYFLDVCVVNAFILWQHTWDGKSRSLKQFRLDVAKGLIGASDPNEIKRGGPQKPNSYKKTVPFEVRYDQCLHMPVRCGSQRCANCSTAKSVHRSYWKCTTCDVGLCLNKDRNCFSSYHTK